MAIVGNVVSTEGDTIIIKTENPSIGVLTLVGYTDTSAGETGTNYFERTFKFSLNGGVTWSDVIPLTLQNIQAIPITKYSEFIAEFYYTAVGPNPSGLSVSEVDIQDTTTSLPIPPYFKNSVFSTYFNCFDTELINWYCAVVEKLFHEDIVARFISRLNSANSPDDFILFFKSIAKFFAYYVILARKISQFSTSLSAVSEFLEGRGITVGKNSTYADVLLLLNQYLYQIHNRGTIKIIDQKIPSLPHLSAKPVNGELLRTFDYESPDEFLFNLYRTEHFGWNLRNSSPLYQGLSLNENVNKIYEPNEAITNLSYWPTVGTVTKIVVGTTDTFQIAGNGSIGNLPTANRIKVNEALDYELDFYVKKPTGTDFSVGIDCYDYSGTVVNSLNIKTGGISSFFFQNTDFRADVYLHIKCIIYNSSKTSDTNSVPNINTGNNLIFGTGTVTVVPKLIYSGSGNCDINSITFLPLKTNYSRGFIQTHNFISCIYKDNRRPYEFVGGELYPTYSAQQQYQFFAQPILDLENYIKNFLIPYNSHIKMTNIGEQLLSGSITPFVPSYPSLSWMGSGISCSFSSDTHNHYVGTSTFTTLLQINTISRIPTGVSKPNTFGDPDYIAPALNPTSCTSYSTTWIGNESDYVCLTSLSQNTGLKSYNTILEKRIDTGVLTGASKANSSLDPDYVAPVTDVTDCPLPATINYSLVEQSTTAVDCNLQIKDNSTTVEDLFTNSSGSIKISAGHVISAESYSNIASSGINPKIHLVITRDGTIIFSNSIPETTTSSILWSEVAVAGAVYLVQAFSDSDAIINYSLTQSSSPYIDGNLQIKSNGTIIEDLFSNTSGSTSATAGLSLSAESDTTDPGTSGLGTLRQVVVKDGVTIYDNSTPAIVGADLVYSGTAEGGSTYDITTTAS